MSRFTIKSTTTTNPTERSVSATGYPITEDGYKLLNIIGQGSFSVVHRALVMKTNEEVAVKVVDLDRGSVSLEEIWHEVQIMKQCSHENVTPLHASFVVGTALWLVLPLLRYGSILDIMKVAHPRGLDEATIATILKMALKGIAYFHQNDHIHRDIKAGNILLSDDGQVQLADFGVSGLIDRSLYKTRQTFVGTPCWMAPEVMEQTSGYDFKADIWSFGITALELAHGQAPMAKFKPMKVLVMTLQNPPPTLDVNSGAYGVFTKQFKKMIESCLQKDPSQRPTAAKLLEHKFFKLAKKPEFLVEKLLTDLPPYEDRQRILKELSANSNAAAAAPASPSQDDNEPVVLPDLDAWDFGPEDNTPVPPGATDSPPKTPEKHGRFTVQ